jgi:hypothetical protein
MQAIYASPLGNAARRRIENIQRFAAQPPPVGPKSGSWLADPACFAKIGAAFGSHLEKGRSIGQEIVTCRHRTFPSRHARRLMMTAIPSNLQSRHI